MRPDFTLPCRRAICAQGAGAVSSACLRAPSKSTAPMAPGPAYHKTGWAGRLFDQDSSLAVQRGAGDFDVRPFRGPVLPAKRHVLDPRPRPRAARFR